MVVVIVLAMTASHTAVANTRARAYLENHVGEDGVAAIEADFHCDPVDICSGGGDGKWIARPGRGCGRKQNTRHNTVGHDRARWHLDFPAPVP